MIVRRDWRTLAHERYNCDWIEEQDIGVVVRSAGDTFDAVQEILRPERYRQLRENLARRRNDAVFEVPAMLERILRSRLAEPGGAAGRAQPRTDLIPAER
jgi:1,2-diacylglycerol 3-beta-galactosyltransferase